ncbi:hypothetical protein [Neobacillus sp. PS3-40]|uniref:hypothetical protein n=1 Tax=Neobacillus sp. PS3-40 TaxID=3070679 RepID=UPI0027DF782C|nr:hypothetical protein [Neobacillus sp. PS3-40]WML43124.1 hypothetical protein RCG20_15115 [Neobacillus sp. PS3-40]
MKDPFSKFQKERDEKIIQSLFEAIRLLSKENSVEEVAEHTGLELKDVLRIKKAIDF